MKLLVETTGYFTLMDGSLPYPINKNRPTVVPNTGFVGARISCGQLRVISQVPDAADDAEFAQYWKDSEGDKELAVASYLSKFEPKDAVEDEAPKRPARKPKDA